MRQTSGGRGGGRGRRGGSKAAGPDGYCVCPKCGYKNVVRSKFCNQCAAGLESALPKAPSADTSDRQTEHRDIAHPITLEFRETIQKKVIDAYQAKKSSLPQSTPFT